MTLRHSVELKGITGSFHPTVIFFCKRATNYRALLQKMTNVDQQAMTLRHPIAIRRSPRRSHLQYLDLQNLRFNRKLFWVTGTPFIHVKPCLKCWGLPRKRVWHVRGLLWKLVGHFGNRNALKADLLERWGAGVETQKNVREEIGGWGRVPFNEPYAPLLSTIYDGA